MRFFAWLTFLTGLVLSGTAAYFSVFGLALIYAGAFWPVVILASVMECAKLVSVSWLFRYRHLVSWPIRVYFIAATILLASITSMGIFGYLTRAHVETEGTAVVSQLALDEIAAREASLLDQRQQLNTELASLTQQSSQLLTQLGNAGRLAGASGAVACRIIGVAASLSGISLGGGTEARTDFIVSTCMKRILAATNNMIAMGSNTTIKRIVSHTTANRTVSKSSLP